MTPKSTIIFFFGFLTALLLPSISLAQNSGIINFEALDDPSFNEVGSIEGERVKNLVYEIQPTVYLVEQQVKSFGEAPPVRAEIEIKDLSMLAHQNELYNSVELLTVKIPAKEDFHRKISTKLTENFPMLKYILVQCNFDCGVNQISDILPELTDIQVFYLNAMPQ